VGKKVGFVLNGLGLLANLTIKENIMLPVLYHKTKHSADVMKRLAALVEETGLQDIMEERAGLRSARVNNEVSLCRCVLQEAAYVLMQQPQSSMSMKEAKQFTQLMLKVVGDLRAGVVYLTASADDCGGFTASNQINLKLQEKVS
jgi:ABC-type lipoprotein export system ATPase subunit